MSHRTINTKRTRGVQKNYYNDDNDNEYDDEYDDDNDDEEYDEYNVFSSFQRTSTTVAPGGGQINYDDDDIDVNDEDDDVDDSIGKVPQYNFLSTVIFNFDHVSFFGIFGHFLRTSLSH